MDGKDTTCNLLNFFNCLTVLQLYHLCNCISFQCVHCAFLKFFFQFPVSGVLVSMTQNGRKNWNYSEHTFFHFH